jgi:hypothetical protein
MAHPLHTLKIVQRHIEERSLLSVGQFGFRARHRTTIQCMRLTDHVNLNFNMSTTAEFLDIEKACGTTRHLGLLYRVSGLKFLVTLIELIFSFLSQRKLSVSVEGEMSTPRDIQAGVLQGSVLSTTLYGLYINDTTRTPSTYLDLVIAVICIYARDRKQLWLSLSK